MLLIHKVLAVHRDLALGKGTVVQQRGLDTDTEQKIELAFIFRTIDEIKNLDTDRYLRVQLHAEGANAEYWYDEFSTSTPDDTTVIKPNNIPIAVAGRWLLVEVIVEYSAIATADGGDGTIEGDVNAMDWSGHPYAQGSTLNIKQNHLVIFSNEKGKIYLWVGPKPVFIGLNGTYTTIASDYLVMSSLFHDDLVDVTPNQHHDQQHNHDGSDGSGQIVHSDLLGITPDNHHPQLHNLTSHIDVDLLTDPPINNERLAWDSVLQLWVPKQSISALGIIEFDYRTSILDSTPAAGRVSTDNADPLLVTLVYLHQEDLHAQDRSLFYDNFRQGDWINAHDPDDTSVTRSYDVIADPTKIGDVYHIPVAYYSANGPALANNSRVTLFLRYTGTLSHDGLVDVTHSQHHNRFVHESDYLLGPVYLIGTHVWNADYISIAKEDTDEFAFPEVVGDPSYLLPDIPAWVPRVSSVAVWCGLELSPPVGRYYSIDEYRIWLDDLTANYDYSVWVLYETGEFNKILGFKGDAQDLVVGWNIIPYESVLFGNGAVYKLFLRVLNSSTGITVDGGWSRQGDDNNNNPTTGGWNKSNDGTTLRFNITDLDTDNRQTELLSMIAGTTIDIVDSLEPNRSVTYSVLTDPILNNDAVIYDVTEVDTGPWGVPAVGNTTTMTASVPTPAVTDYAEIIGGTSGYPNVAGLLSLTGSGGDAIATPDAYMLDIKIKEWAVSDKWDVTLKGGSGGGGGSSDFVPAVFTGAGSSGYVPNPGTEEGKVLKDDGTWGAAGGGATESSITQGAHGFAVLDAVRFNGVSWVKAQANDIGTTALGIVVAVQDVNNFTFAMSGRYQLGGLIADQWYYLDELVAGGLNTVEPAISQPIIYAEDGSWVVIYPYRPSYSTAPTDPMIGEVKAVTSLASLSFGWHLADGTNGTQDLRGKAIFGDGANGIVAGADGGALPVGGVSGLGGSVSSRKTTDNDGHAHAFGTNNDGAHGHNYISINLGTGAAQNVVAQLAADGVHQHTGTTGIETTHEHTVPSVSSHQHTTPAGTLPPYRGMYLIEYTGVA